MRLFLAIDLPAPLKRRLAAEVQQLAGRADVKWVRTDGLHLTLHFFGETPPDQVTALSQAMDSVCARHAPFPLRLEGAGTFGRPRTPRVLWLGVAGDLAAAAALQHDLAEAVQAAAEREPWTPHLTLARSRHPRGDPALTALAAQLRDLPPAPFPVAEVVLLESRNGAYTPRHVAPLRLPAQA